MNANVPLSNGAQPSTGDASEQEQQTLDKRESPTDQQNLTTQEQENIIRDQAEANNANGTNINQVADTLASVRISEPSSISMNDNSTVSPVNIGQRKVPTGSTDIGQSRASNQDSSPHDLPLSIAEAIIAGEGPMTPRNDAGPFVLDGSAGESSDIRVTSLAAIDFETESNDLQSQSS